MTKNTLLWHFEKHDFYITKIINEEFYSKSYIREKIEDSDNYFVIDNSKDSKETEKIILNESVLQ